jgi:hypothetical protein
MGPERGILRGSGLLIKYVRLIRDKLQSKWLFCLCLLLAVDVAFIVLHVLYGRKDSPFSILNEYTYAETFQHFQEAFITLLLVILALRVGSFLYFGWSLLFLYVWIDDSLQVHETVGTKVGEGLGSQSVLGLPHPPIGEAVMAGCIGPLFLLFIATAHRFSYDPVSKQQSKVLLVLLGVYVFFAFALDGAHTIASALQAEPWRNLLAIGEDGGEMVVMSIILWFVLLTAEQQVASREQVGRTH